METPCLFHFEPNCDDLILCHHAGMNDPNLAPADCVSDIEGTQSSSPLQGVGSHLRSLDPSNEIVKRGRVDDIYMDKFCAVVSIYGYRKGVPCFWGSDSSNQLTGAKTIAPPSVGTEVGVILSMDQKYGYIIATYVSASNAMPSPSLFATSVSRGSDNEVHIAKNFGFGSCLPAAAGGTPTDVLPGDHVIVNGAGAMLALLELSSMIGAGTGATMETFVVDQIARATGWNEQTRNSLAERNVMEDWGNITEDESGTHLIAETMGNDPDGEVPEEQAAIARRFQNLRGQLGGLVQRWIMRPNSLPSDMTKAKDQPDLGLMHRVEMLSGLFADRSVVGGGFMKVPAIPVPKRMKLADDPTGNVKAPKGEPVKPFVFSPVPESPMSAHCQLRDFMAWLFNKQMTQHLLEQDLDWVVPDEADCAALAKQLEAPRLGRFSREYPPEVDAMSEDAAENITKDKSEVMKTRPGLAWCLVLPNGDVSIRDIFGSQISMAGGHIDISASKDIRISAGRNLVLLGGDDLIIKGRNAVDITSSLSQVRIKAQRELFIHAEEGGMLISLGSPGSSFTDGKGEEVRLPGICVKVPGGFIIDAQQFTANLSKNFYVGQGTDGSYPYFTGRFADAKWDIQNGGFAMKFADGGAEFSGGSLFASGNIQGEGSCFIKGSGVFGSEPSWPGEWNGEPVADIIARSFASLDDLQYPYSIDELKKAQFSFRTDSQYSVSGGKWFQSFWQRETTGLIPWQEKPAKDGSYPYPGQSNYVDDKNWWTYKEQNVEPVGRSKARDSLSDQPDGFTPNTWNAFTVHPNQS